MTGIDIRDPQAIDGLVRLAQAGGNEAFDRLVLALHRPLRSAVAAHAINAEQIEEIVQQAWITAWESLPRYECRGSFLAWVKGIARNLLLADLRARARLRSVDGDRLDHLLGSAALADLDDEDRALEQERRLERLGRCLERLPARSQTLIVARDRDGQPLATLAQRFKQTKGRLATALWRLRQTLRECLAAGAEP